MPKKRSKAKKQKKAQLKKRRLTVRKKKSPVRKTAGKPIRKKPAIKKPRALKKGAKKIKKPVVEGVIVGKITHYYPHVNAAVLKAKSPLKIGDTVRVKGHTTDFQETVTSMQINRVAITEAKKGDEIGLLVSSRVRGRDIVYKI